jgi:hypothetical protein
VDYDNLVKKVNELIAELKIWQDFALKTKEKDKDLTKLQEELTNRENIVQKETVIARDRKEVLDAREKNIEAQEDRLRRIAQV